MRSERIVSIDWLRGLTAISIMLYHYILSMDVALDASTTLGRMGVYGVSIFFVLSGLSMTIVYNKYLVNVKTSIRFYIRRIFRIWPLLWVAIFVLVAYTIIFNRPMYSTEMIFLNLTTLFAFIDPGAYMNTGAWSIGNEMVYYTLTPFIIMLYNKNKSAGNILFVISLIIGLGFSQAMLSPNYSLDEQWNKYINPFNNFFFYFSGIAIWYNLNEKKLKAKFNILILGLSGCFFVFLPCKGDLITIITGSERIIFSLLSILIVVTFFKLQINIPMIISKPLELLGEGTYSIYLLHPFVIVLSNKLLFVLFSTNNPAIQILVASTVTIIISLISYRLFEMPFIKIGKNLTVKY